MTSTLKDTKRLTATQLFKAFQKFKPRLGNHCFKMLPVNYSALRLAITATQITHPPGQRRAPSVGCHRTLCPNG